MLEAWYTARQRYTSAEARLAEAQERIGWFEKSGGVAVHTRVFQEMARAEEADAQLSEARRQIQALHETTRALTQKLQAMLADPSYLSIVALAAVHGFTYTGPNFKDELDTVERALARPHGPEGTT